MRVATHGCWEKQFWPQLPWEDNWKLMSGLSCPLCFFLLLILSVLLLSQTRTTSTTALLGSTKTEWIIEPDGGLGTFWNPTFLHFLSVTLGCMSIRGTDGEGMLLPKDQVDKTEGLQVLNGVGGMGWGDYFPNGKGVWTQWTAHLDPPPLFFATLVAEHSLETYPSSLPGTPSQNIGPEIFSGACAVKVRRVWGFVLFLFSFFLPN